jgi:hypothetical protein
VVGVGRVAEGISWAIGGDGKFYLHKNRFRTTAFGGHGTVAYDLFGAGTASGDAGLSIPIRQGGNLGQGEFLVRIFGKLFVLACRRHDAQLCCRPSSGLLRTSRCQKGTVCIPWPPKVRCSRRCEATISVCVVRETNREQIVAV